MKKNVIQISRNDTTRPANKPALNVAQQAEPAARKWTASLVGGMDALIKWAIPPLLGLLVFLVGWSLLAEYSPQLPGPVKTWHAAVEVFSDPFYDNGPNDKGIGWNILGSLERVGLGFGLAALVGIPLGFMIGRFVFLNKMTAPIISLLRPVSPLAWLPIGLLVFQEAQPAAIWVIFITCIWPMVINTAVGVTRVPQDYLNVARTRK